MSVYYIRSQFSNREGANSILKDAQPRSQFNDTAEANSIFPQKGSGASSYFLGANSRSAGRIGRSPKSRVQEHFGAWVSGDKEKSLLNISLAPVIHSVRQKTLLLFTKVVKDVP